MSKLWSDLTCLFALRQTIFRIVPNSRGSCQMDWKAVKTCTLVRRVHISTFIAKAVMFCYQRKVQKPQHGWLGNCFCGVTTGVRANIEILETYVAIVATSFPRKSVDMSAGEVQASFCCCYNSVDFEYMCLTGLPAVQISLLLKMYHEEDNQKMVTTDCCAAGLLYPARMRMWCNTVIYMSVFECCRHQTLNFLIFTKYN